MAMNADIANSPGSACGLPHARCAHFRHAATIAASKRVINNPCGNTTRIHTWARPSAIAVTAMPLARIRPEAAVAGAADAAEPADGSRAGAATATPA
ncbi:hypothetical protein GCM10009628_22420 [Paeniglutamicibacter kerguelensis]